DVINVDAAAGDVTEQLYAWTKAIAPAAPIHLLGRGADATILLGALARHPDLAARAGTLVILQPTGTATEASSEVAQVRLDIEGDKDIPIREAVVGTYEALHEVGLFLPPEARR